MNSNPFFELYAGERISPNDFVNMFSDKLVPHAIPIFAPGNAVVTGKQGSGKSMLLSLLRPKIRLQYEKSNKDFPIPKMMRNFLSANVNLAHSHAVDFGLRSAQNHDAEDIQLYFADFLNFLIVKSLTSCIKIYLAASDGIKKEVGLSLDPKIIDDVIPILSSHPVWEGWIGECHNIDEFDAQLDKRIRGYRRYLHKKTKTLDPSFLGTRTSIGEPILVFADIIRKHGLIKEDTHVFVDIDQYEELVNILTDQVDGHMVDYRATINKALANRNDSKVSYRIGTRGHAWRNHGKIMGTKAKLEQERDYKFVELDEILTRKENAKAHIFPKFAKDVFNRRMKFTNFDFDVDQIDAIDIAYGKRITPDEKVKRLSLRVPERALRFDGDFSDKSKMRLRNLAKKDLMSAKLGEIWIRQKGDGADLEVNDSELPWKKKAWWIKERKDVAALQIASDAQQKSLWGGADEVIDLSGGNILVFLSLNQYIWDTWVLYKGAETEGRETLPKIDIQIQSMGVLKASKYWVEKINQETGMSSERARFVANFGQYFNKKLFSDRKISNPGHNGFSVVKSDLTEFTELNNHMGELADYGNLLMLDHTTKLTDRKPRTKFYLNPIFCPYFGIPYIRTKEPYYTKIKEVSEWLFNAGYPVSLGHSAEQPLKPFL